MGVLGIWEVGEGGGPLFPKVNVKILANFNFLVKTKNVPKGLKCKMNIRGGGAAIWEKFPNNTLNFLNATPVRRSQLIPARH